MRHDGSEALLSDANVDAVYVPTPNSLHAGWAIKATQAGTPEVLDRRESAQFSFCAAGTKR